MRHATWLARLLGGLVVLISACGGSHPSSPTDGPRTVVDRDSGPGGERDTRRDDRRPREGRDGRR